MKPVPSVMRPEWVEARKDREWPVHTLPEGVVEVREPIPSRYFLTVSAIFPGTPAEKAGLRVGDVITHVGGERILDDGRSPLTAADIQARLLEVDADGGQEIFFIRDGYPRDCTIVPRFDESEGGIRFGVGYHMDDRPEILRVMPGECIRVPYSFESPQTARSLTGFVDFGPVEADFSGMLGREIRRHVILFAGADQVTREYDLLERFNSSRARVYATPGLIHVEGHYLPCPSEDAFTEENDSGEVRIANPLRPNAAHTLVHELRHGDQWEKKAFAKLFPFYRSTDDHRYANPVEWTDLVQRPRGREALSEILEHFLDRREVAELLRPFHDAWFFANERAEAAKAVWHGHDTQLVMRRALFGNDASDDEMRELADLVASTRRTYLEARKALPDAETIVFGSVTVQDIFRLPIFVIERDAEYGALTALRAVRRETGVPILGSYELEEEERKLGVLRSADASGTRIDSLLEIEGYMRKIGVSMNCLRDLRAVKKAIQKTPDPRLDEAAYV